jgi:hypothetical protein
MSLTPTLAMGILRVSEHFCMSGMDDSGAAVRVRGMSDPNVISEKW